MQKLTWIITVAVGLIMVHQLGSDVLAQSGGPDMRMEQLLMKLEQLSGASPSQVTTPRAKARRKGKLRKKFVVRDKAGIQCPTEARLSASHSGVGETYSFSASRPIDLSGGNGSVIVDLNYDLPNADTVGLIFLSESINPRCTTNGGGPLNVPSASYSRSFNIGMPPTGTTTTLDDTLIVTSDARAKRDIVQVGWLASGLKLYRYRYLWSDTTYVGVMAQEVAAVMPEAVVRGADGYLRVDYAHLGFRRMTWSAWRRAVRASLKR